MAPTLTSRRQSSKHSVTAAVLVDDHDEGDLEKLRQSLPEVDDDTAVRFLLGSDNNLAEAERKLNEYLRWRKEYKPEQITREEVACYIDAGEGRILDDVTDTAGNSVAYVRIGLHNTYPVELPADISKDDHFQRFMVYLMETGLRRTGRLSFIFDLNDLKWTNIDFAQVKTGISLFNDRYPECLGVCLCLAPSIIFHLAFKIIRYMIGPRTAQRIHIIKNEQHLSPFVDPEKLPSS